MYYAFSIFFPCRISFGGQGGIEEISFQLYNPQKARYYAHYESLPFESDAVIGTLNKPYRFSNLPPDNAFNVAVYPNPFQYQIFLDIVSDVEQDYTVSVCDLMGRVIGTYNVPFAATQTTATQQSIELKTDDLDLVEGVYLLHIKGSLGEQKAVKVVFHP